MAHAKSAKKRIRQTDRRTERGRHYRTMVRRKCKKLLEIIDSGEKAKAESELKEVVALVQKAGSKGILHKNRTANLMSSLTRRVTNLG